MGTDDLLFLLASFGRGAPADMCDAQPTDALNPTEAQTAREVLYCTLRDTLQSNIDQIQQYCDGELATAAQEVVAAQTLADDTGSQFELLNATYWADLLRCSDQLNTTQQYHLAQRENLIRAHAAELAAVTLAREQDAVAHQQQLRALQCATPVVAHADIFGDPRYGGSGLTLVCHDGYADNGVTNTTLVCTASGIFTGEALVCTPINPCSEDEDDCDALADCTHTGPGEHSCECVSGVSFGSGQSCTLCTTSPCDTGQVLTTACNSTNDAVCEPVVASQVLPQIDGATITYSNGFSYPTTATYTCDSGYDSISHALLPDGTWEPNPTILACEPDFSLGSVDSASGLAIQWNSPVPMVEGILSNPQDR